MRAMTVQDVAREFGRSAGWMLRHWQELVAAKKLPQPIIEAGGLTWSAPQVYAVLDRGLTPKERAAAAAYRAAFEAASQPPDLQEQDAIAAAHARRDQKNARRHSG